jgi:hypothetical protein
VVAPQGGAALVVNDLMNPAEEGSEEPWKSPEEASRVLKRLGKVLKRLRKVLKRLVKSCWSPCVANYRS